MQRKMNKDVHFHIAGNKKEAKPLMWLPVGDTKRHGRWPKHFILFKKKSRTVLVVWFLFMLKKDKNKSHVYKYIEKALKDTCQTDNCGYFGEGNGIGVWRQGCCILNNPNYNYICPFKLPKTHSDVNCMK